MSIAQITAYSLGIIVAQSLVLERLPGADPFFGITRSPGRAFGAGLGVALALLLGTAATWPFARLLEYLGLFHLQTLVFLLVIAIISVLFEAVTAKLPPSLRAGLGVHPKGIAVNSAVMGAVMLGSQRGFLSALSAALAAGAGFTVIAVLFASVRERVGLMSDCPRSMEGLPLTLIAAGLLALAFMGFQGLAPILR